MKISIDLSLREIGIINCQFDLVKKNNLGFYLSKYVENLHKRIKSCQNKMIDLKGFGLENGD